MSTSSDTSLRSEESIVSSTITSLMSNSSSSWELSKRFVKIALGETISIVIRITKVEIMCVLIFVFGYKLDILKLFPCVRGKSRSESEV